MSRSHLVLLSILVLMVSGRLLSASTVYVGGCHSPSYAKIQDAVNAVAPSSIINVCPGTYPEQVTISKALTLQGILNNNSAQAVITLPSGPLTKVHSIIFTSPLAPHVLVTADSVNISKITFDEMCTGSGDSAGIMYASGSSGTVNEIEIRNYCGSVGILAENGAGSSQSVTIQNSNMHNGTAIVAILTCSDQTPPTLTTTIKGNYIANENDGIIALCNGSGSVLGNVVHGGGAYGIYDGASSTLLVSGNTVTDAKYGIYTTVAGLNVTSNKIFNSTNAIVVGASDESITSNTIINPIVGIDFQCYTATVAGNTIKGAATGISSVPATFTGVNSFYNVATVRTGGCP